MGLDFLRRHLNAIIVWTLLTGTLALTIIAICGAIVGRASLANNTGAGAFFLALVGGIYGSGYATATHTQRATRLEQVEQSLDDVQTRLTRIEDEQLNSITDTLAEVERALGVNGENNVRSFRRGS